MVEEEESHTQDQYKIHLTDTLHLNKDLKKRIVELKRQYQSIPTSQRLRHYIEQRSYGSYIDFASALFSILSVLVYIIETYTDLGIICKRTDIFFCSVFFIEYIFRLYISEYKLSYILKWESAIDILTILPPVINLFLRILYHINRRFNFTFFRFIRILRMIRILRIHRLMSRTDSIVQRKIVNLCFAMISLIFCSAGAFLETEYNQLKYFHHGLYWASQTVATIGYGDIVPETEGGKIVVMLTITAVITIVPYQTNELLTLLNRHSYYQRVKYTSFKSGSHVVITGFINLINLIEFIEEFYHSDHGFEDRDIVLLAPNPPDRHLEYLVNRKETIIFIEGSPMLTKDLTRAAIHNATAVFILCDKQASDPVEEDANNTLISLSISQYCKSFIKSQYVPNVIIQILLKESRVNIASFISGPLSEKRMSINQKEKPLFIIICLNEIKLSLLSLSCSDCPGIITFICNLCRSYSNINNNNELWKKEYVRGASMEIYAIPLSPAFKGHNYNEVAKIIFKELGAILIAIDNKRIFNVPLTSSNYQSNLKLVPSHYVIDDVKNIVGYVIAPDLESCLGISTYNVPHISSFIKEIFRDNKILKNECKAPSLESKISKYFKEISFIHHLCKMSCKLIQSFKPLRNSSKRQLSSKFPFSNSEDQLKNTLFNIALLQSKSNQIKLNEKIIFSKSNIHTHSEKRQSNNQLTLNDITLKKIDFSNHILIFGISGISSIYHLISPLRKQFHNSTLNLHPIVIVDTNLPRHHIWKELIYFKDIFFFHGSPHLLDDLSKLNVIQAQCAIILHAHKNSKCPNYCDNFNNVKLDADIILTYNNLSIINPKLPIYLEMNSATNLAFFLPIAKDKYISCKDFIEDPLYASGRIFLSGFFDTLSCQTFFNKDIIKIISKMLLNVDCENQNNLIMNQCICQISVPDNYIGKTFYNAFSAFLDNGYLCVALYRQNLEFRGNSMPYVYTNPIPDVILEKEDKIIVLKRSELCENECTDVIDTEEMYIQSSSNFSNNSNEDSKEDDCTTLPSPDKRYQKTFSNCNYHNCNSTTDQLYTSTSNQWLHLIDNLEDLRTQTLNEIDQLRNDIQEIKYLLSDKN